MLVTALSVIIAGLTMNYTYCVLEQRKVNKILKEGKTKDKDKMLKAFEYYVEHAKNPNIWITVDAINDSVYCRWQTLDIDSSNIELVRECIISQEWNKIFPNAPDIDFEKLKTINGNYKPYDVFILDYCLRDK